MNYCAIIKRIKWHGKIKAKPFHNFVVIMGVSYSRLFSLAQKTELTLILRKIYNWGNYIV